MIHNHFHYFAFLSYFFAITVIWTHTLETWPYIHPVYIERILNVYCEYPPNILTIYRLWILWGYCVYTLNILTIYRPRILWISSPYPQNILTIYTCWILWIYTGCILWDYWKAKQRTFVIKGKRKLLYRAQIEHVATMRREILTTDWTWSNHEACNPHLRLNMQQPCLF